MQQAIAKKQKVQQLTSLFADEVKPGEKEWQQLVAMLDGDIGEELRKVEFVSYDGKTVLINASREQCQKIEKDLTDDVLKYMKNHAKKIFGKVIWLNYFLSDK